MEHLTYKDSFDCCGNKKNVSEQEQWKIDFFDKYLNKMSCIFKKEYSKQIFGTTGHSTWINTNKVLYMMFLNNYIQLYQSYIDNIEEFELEDDVDEYERQIQAMKDCIKNNMKCI